MRVDPERGRLLDLGQLVEGRQRDVDEVTDAGDVEQDLVRSLRRKTSGQAADHGGILAVSDQLRTALSPSGASLYLCHPEERSDEGSVFPRRTKDRDPSLRSG